MNPTAVARQPILDRAELIVGYELLFRGADGMLDDGSQMSIHVLADLFTSLGTEAVLGEARGYLNLTRELLLSPLIELLPRSRFVLEVLEDVEPDDEVRKRCRQLRASGFCVALDDYVLGDPRANLLSIAEVVKVDLPAVPDRDLPRLVASLRRKGVAILAEKVETREEFVRCRELGFDLFQGYFFAKPELIAGHRVEPETRVLMETLQLARRNGETSEIAAAIKPHAELSLQLLRIVNSVGMGAVSAIRNLEHALTFLGRRQLERWLQLLMFARGDARGFRSPLTRTAVIRARTLELAAEQLEKDRPDVRIDTSAAFMVGMLSLAEALLHVPLREIADTMKLDESISAALIDHSGELGQMLEAVLELEAGRLESAGECAAQVGLEASDFSGFVTEAMRWAESSTGG